MSARIAIFGTGGMGGGYGSLLAESGADVTFVARGAFLEALKTRGLRVRQASGDLLLPRVSACAPDDPPGTFDVVVVAVKSYDLEAAFRSIERFVGPDTTVVSLLNGIDPPERIAEVFGSARTVVAQCSFCAWVSGPGEITRAGTRQGLALGELDRAAGPRTRDIATMFERAGVKVDISDDVRASVWRKLIWTASRGGVAAVARVDAGEIRSSPALTRLLHDALIEAYDVCCAMKLALPPDTVAQWMKVLEQVTTDSQASITNDLEHGRPLEIDTLGGAIVRRGAELGVPTPIHRVFCDVLGYAHQRALARRTAATTDLGRAVI